MLSMKQWFCLFASLTLLSGCGFHLRGPVELAPPLRQVYLQTQDPYSELSRNIREYFKESGAKLTTSPQTATSVLDIISETPSQQLLSVGSTQQTRQYNLTLTVVFTVTTPQGKILVPQQAVTETQTITVQADQILGGSNEENNLYHQMRRAIVYTLMNRLASKNTSEQVMAKP